MYVIEDSDGLLFPADRCTFSTIYSSTIGSYTLSSPTFYSGNNNGTAIGTPATLGYIGKTGRFVPMTRN